MRTIGVLIAVLLFVVGVAGWLIRKVERVVGIAGPVVTLLCCLAAPARADASTCEPLKLRYDRADLDKATVTCREESYLAQVFPGPGAAIPHAVDDKDAPPVAAPVTDGSAPAADAPRKITIPLDDIVLDNIAPYLTKCWGTACVMPDAAVNAILINVATWKREAGAVSLGGGVALLLWADTPYASGIAAHLTGVLTDEPGRASFAMPTVGLVFARYLQVGLSRRIVDGPDSTYISVAGNLPWDLFTRATIPERAQMARAARGGDGQ